jgi:hypothetical protein
MLLAYGIYNLGTTGNFFLAGYSTGGDLNEVVGFGGAHSVGLGIQNEQTQLASLLLVFNGWPQFVGIAIIIAPFVLGTRNRWDWTFLACALAVLGVYTFYEAPGLMHGPRYWYEAMPFLVLLAARGAESLAVVASDVAGRVAASFRAPERRATWLGAILVYPVVAILSLNAAYDWVHGEGLGFGIDTVPAAAKELRGFNGVNATMVDSLEAQDLDNALVLVDACTNWQCLGSVFWMNSPTLDGDVVYAKNLDQRNAELFQKYPDRLVYRASYLTGEVLPFGRTAPITDGEDGEAPRADTIPTSTPAPTPTPDLARAERDDARRRADLDRVRDGLAQYYAAHGGYPRAEGVQTLCVYSFDSGCALKEFIDIPADPNPQATYWYQSDGKTFSVFASMEGPGDPSTCPDPIPPHLAQTPNLYCVRSTAAAP